MKVDVVLPVYKPNQWVFEAIESVFNQSYLNWHLTIIDDCTPGHNEIISQIKAMAFHNRRMTYIRLNQNKKVSTARNIGMANSSGDAIAFLDQDDKWHPEKLEHSVKYFRSNKEVKFVHSNIEGIGENGELLPDVFDEENTTRDEIPYSRMDNKKLSREVFKRCLLRLGTVMVLRDSFEEVGGFDGDLFGGEDLEFAVRFAKRFKIGHLSEKLTYRRIHSGNVSKVYRKVRLKGKLKAIYQIGEDYPYLEDLAREKYVSLLRKMIKLELDGKDRKKAERDALTLIKLSPFDPRAYVLLGISFFRIDYETVFSYYRKIKRSSFFRQGGSNV